MLELLIDARRAAQEQPELYHLPSAEQLAKIQPGCCVKVQYGFKDVMAKVLTVHEDGKIRAKIDDKGSVKRLKKGDVVVVSEKNIIEIK